MIPVKIKNARLKLVLFLPVANDAIEMLPVVTVKQLMTYQITKKKHNIFAKSFCSFILFL